MKRKFINVLTFALLSIAFVAVTLMGTVPAHAATGWTAFSVVQTGGAFSMYLSGAPGTTITSSIHLTNAGTLAGSGQLIAADGVTDQRTGIQGNYNTPSKLGVWMSLPKDPITLTSMQSVDLPISVTIPSNATGQYGGQIIARTLSSSTGTTGGNTITVINQMAMKVILTVSGTPQIYSMSNPAPLKAYYFYGWTIGIPLSNTGNMVVTGSMAVKITDSNGVVVIQNTTSIRDFLPGDTITYPYYAATLAKGKYTVNVSVSYQNPQPLAFSGNIQIS